MILDNNLLLELSANNLMVLSYSCVIGCYLNLGNIEIGFLDMLCKIMALVDSI